MIIKFIIKYHKFYVMSITHTERHTYGRYYLPGSRLPNDRKRSYSSGSRIPKENIIDCLSGSRIYNDNSCSVGIRKNEDALIFPARADGNNSHATGCWCIPLQLLIITQNFTELYSFWQVLISDFTMFLLSAGRRLKFGKIGLKIEAFSKFLADQPTAPRPKRS